MLVAVRSDQLIQPVPVFFEIGFLGKRVTPRDITALVAFEKLIGGRVFLLAKEQPRPFPDARL